jgi:EAL domain-containing protein (putative c-di-GMP-specific phosphodiesterase class I)
MTDTGATALGEVLSDRDIHFLELLERRVATVGATKRPSGTLFDLERIAELIDCDQPEIVFQPIVELASERVAGYEALSRFHLEPRRSPDVWFAQAARVGLGVELELKAVSVALGLLAEVPERAFLSLNVSGPTLCSSALQAVLAPVAGDRVVLELTEHEVIEDYDELNAAMARFRRSGFRLAVDDAGTGCSGFSHILRVSPDVIKLDRTITRSIDLHAGREDMAASLVALARGIGATVVAEGVETNAELNALVRLGVDEGQGYLFGRPASTPWRFDRTDQDGRFCADESHRTGRLVDCGDMDSSR